MVAAQFDPMRIIGMVLFALFAVIGIDGRLSGDDSSDFGVEAGIGIDGRLSGDDSSDFGVEACSDTPLASTCGSLRSSACCGVGANPMSAGWALEDILAQMRRLDGDIST
jgi:hypothetical protein